MMFLLSVPSKFVFPTLLLNICHERDHDVHPNLYNLQLSHYIKWRRKWQPTPVLLPGKSHGQRSPVGYSPWGRKESDTTESLHFTSCQLLCKSFGRQPWELSTLFALDTGVADSRAWLFSHSPVVLFSFCSIKEANQWNVLHLGNSQPRSSTAWTYKFKRQKCTYDRSL